MLKKTRKPQEIMLPPWDSVRNSKANVKTAEREDTRSQSAVAKPIRILFLRMINTTTKVEDTKVDSMEVTQKVTEVTSKVKKMAGG